MSRFVFAVRCAILSPMHAIWFRAEYRPSPSVAPWRSLAHPAKSESLNLLSLFVSLCRAGCRVIPVPLLRRYRALEPRSAWQMCNEGLDDSDCANNWESARQGLKAKSCSPIGATTGAIIAVQRFAVQPIAVQCLQFPLHCALKLYFLCARQDLTGRCCTQSVQAMSLRRFSQRFGSTNSAGGREASARGQNR